MVVQKKLGLHLRANRRYRTCQVSLPQCCQHWMSRQMGKLETDLVLKLETDLGMNLKTWLGQNLETESELILKTNLGLNLKTE